MRIRFFVLTFLLLALLAGATVFILTKQNKAITMEIQTITTFEECVAANNLVIPNNPRECRVQSGQVFIENGSVVNTETPSSTSTYRTFGTPITLKIGDTAAFSDGLSVTVQSINDSRCPVGTQCIWAGEISTALSIWVGDLSSNTSNLTLGTVNNTRRTSGQYLFVLNSATESTVTLTVTRSATQVNASEVGTISGQVTIGPICPVENVDNPCVIPPETYTSRSVIVYATNQTDVIKKQPLDAVGNYTVSLPPGTYWLQIQPAGIRAGEKKAVTLTANQAQTVDFDVDTGIR